VIVTFMKNTKEVIELKKTELRVWCPCADKKGNINDLLMFFPC
jgi:DUF971 family protein